ncbi:hypothetical protein LCGC14_2004330, partial [marine sediment metagenome]
PGADEHLSDEAHFMEVACNNYPAMLEALREATETLWRLAEAIEDDETGQHIPPWEAYTKARAVLAKIDSPTQEVAP